MAFGLFLPPQRVPDHRLLLFVNVVAVASLFVFGSVVAVVRVGDNGAGIMPGAEILAPFVTTKAKGMGLGLSICKEIVEAHGGRVEVGSEAGAGAEFQVILPLGPMA